MAQSPFIWGAGGQQLTPDQVERLRKSADASAARGVDTSPVGHWSQGLARLVDAFGGYRGNMRANEQEAAGLASADAIMAGSPVLAALGGVDPAVQAASPFTDIPDGNSFMDSLVASESGGNWGALNNEGYGGRLQFGESRLADAARAGIIPAGLTGAEFSRMSPEQQMAVEQWHFADIDRQAAARGLDRYIGQTIGGVPITQDAIRGMAHLGGIGGTAKFLNSGGAYNPADSNGTSLRDYGIRHGGGATSAQTSGQNVISALSGAQANPWVQQKYGKTIEALMGQEVGRQDAQFKAQLAQQDPAYQLGLQKAQLELDRIQNPVSEYDQRANAAAQYGLTGDAATSFILTGSAPGLNNSALPADFHALQLRAEAAGLPPGSPEYQDFMRSGGRLTNAMPAAVAALHDRAIRAGIPEGSPEYENFMLTGGKGVEAGAAVTGKAIAEQQVAAPANLAAAEDAMYYIDQIRNHPGLSSGTGWSAWQGWIPGSDAMDFSSRVEQLGGGAFLTAIDEMQGMGALSNQEGQTAKAAIARMNQWVSEEDFLQAMADYERIIKRGRDRAMGRISASSGDNPPATTTRKRYNPQTGAFE